MHCHKNAEHSTAQAFPWAPWEQEDGTVDETLKTVCEENQYMIITPFKTEKMNGTVYNLPTNNLTEGMEHVLSFLQTIYAEQRQSFKINVALGFILRNIETGEYRYFTPNQPLWTLPHLVRDLHSFRMLENRLRDFNIIEHVKNEKPNSQWKPFMITNMVCRVTPTQFPLGAGSLPDFVKCAKGLLGLECDTRKRPYTDG